MIASDKLYAGRVDATGEIGAFQVQRPVFCFSSNNFYVFWADRGPFWRPYRCFLCKKSSPPPTFVTPLCAKAVMAWSTCERQRGWRDMPMFVKYLLVAPQRLAQGPDQADGDGCKPWLRSGKVASNKLISASTKATACTGVNSS